MSACARDVYVAPPVSNMTTSGNWKIDTITDRITGAVSPSAMLVAPEASNSEVDFPKPALLQLTCLDKKPIVRFAFEFKIGTDKNTILGYRFDAKPGHDNVESRILVGYTVLVIEDPAEVFKFVEELKTSSALVVRIRSLSGNRTIVDFKLDGAPAAVEAGYAGCPVVMPPPPPEKKKKRRRG
jgi:hypothetical protein